MKDRWFALCGIASVVVELVGTFVQMGSKDTHSLTWTSSDASIVKAFSHHATTVVWVGAYLEILSMGLFLAFAIWLCTRLGGGLFGSIGRGMAVANTAVGMVSLALLDTSAYLAGHALPTSTARALVTLNGATFITTWFLSAFFLLAVAPLALAQGRRIVGWSAVAIAAETLVGGAASPTNLGQLSSMFTLIWVVGVCIALLRREPRRAPVPAVA
ncbi:MAG TPA: hypothetical protein VHQ89_11555 [Gaiellaceae bacterium]|jgi:hypothetical protein|nr:hypothetical protein [Gaiellaceae bacterium]